AKSKSAFWRAVKNCSKTCVSVSMSALRCAGASEARLLTPSRAASKSRLNVARADACWGLLRAAWTSLLKASLYFCEYSRALLQNAPPPPALDGALVVEDSDAVVV